MNKRDLVSALAHETGLSVRKAEEVVNAALKIMSNALSNGEKVKIVGFGSLETKLRAPRVGRDMQENRAIHVPAKKTVVFQTGSDLDKQINNQN